MWMAADLRYAVRSLRQTPLFTAAAVASLGVGIATAITIFSLVDAAILRPPPFADANRLAVLNTARGRNFYGAVGEFATPAVDWRVLAFTATLSACTVLLFGLMPALRATRTDLAGDLKGRGAGTSAPGRRLALRDIVVAFQVASALMLTVGCGLLLTSHARLRETPLGFDPSRLLTFMIRPPEVKYDTVSAPLLIDRLLEAIEGVPGVVAATVDGCAPLSTQCATAPLHILGRPSNIATDAPMVLRHYVAPAHFRTLGVSVVRGRSLSEDDRAGRPPVVVINEAAAKRFWPTEDPIGQRIWFEGAPIIGSPDSPAEIVGIVGNVAYQPLDERPVQPDFFTPYAQFTFANRMVLVRTRGEPIALIPQIADAVRRADPGLALFDVQTMESRARGSWSKHTFQTGVFAVIAIIALTLAVTGVFAVTSYFVASRNHEIGVRMALGANSFDVARASMLPTVRLATGGAALGLLGALALSRVMRAMLYETSPFDAGVFAGAALVLVVAVIAASYVPLRRAVRLNPVDVLRSH